MAIPVGIYVGMCVFCVSASVTVSRFTLWLCNCGTNYNLLKKVSVVYVVVAAAVAAAAVEPGNPVLGLVSALGLVSMRRNSFLGYDWIYCC